jgi:hypothetical protein
MEISLEMSIRSQVPKIWTSQNMDPKGLLAECHIKARVISLGLTFSFWCQLDRLFPSRYVAKILGAL